MYLLITKTLSMYKLPLFRTDDVNVLYIHHTFKPPGWRSRIVRSPRMKAKVSKKKKINDFFYTTAYKGKQFKIKK